MASLGVGGCERCWTRGQPCWHHGGVDPGDGPFSRDRPAGGGCLRDAADVYSGRGWPRWMTRACLRQAPAAERGPTSIEAAEAPRPPKFTETTLTTRCRTWL